MRSWTRRSEALLVAVTVALAPSVAAAQSKVDKKKAVQLSRRAIDQYRLGAYEEAGNLFLRAYELSKRPAQLRNAAKAFEEGKALERALELWVRYRDLGNISRDERAEAEAHVALIEEKQRNEDISRSAREAARAAELARRDAESARRAAEEARATTLVTKEPEAEGSPVGGWILVAAGGVMMAASGALWFVAEDQLSDLDTRLATRNTAGKIIGTTHEDKEADVNRINGQRVAAGVLLPVGAVAAAGGLLWLLLSGDGGPTPGVAVTPDGVSTVLSGRF